MLNMSARKSDSLNTGDVFGKLAFVRAEGSVVGRNGRKEHRSLFKCECGKEKSMVTFRVVSGASRSCGCVNKGDGHGLSGTKIYLVWNGMKTRCSNPNKEGSQHYFDRGIKVCDEWVQSFSAFHLWAIASGYREGLQLDRINNNGNYEPENCRWVTPAVNSNNRRDNRWVEHNGDKLPLGEAVTKYGGGVNYDMVYSRIRKGWSFSDAVSTPPLSLRRKKHEA